MSYDHSLSIHATCMPGVTESQIHDVFEDIYDYLQWDGRVERSSSGNDIEFNEDERGQIVFTLSTYGEVGHSFSERVNKACEKLNPLVEPALAELRDHDTGDLEDAIEQIWVGQGEALVEARKNAALREALETLKAGGFSDQDLKEVSHALGYSVHTEKVNRPKA